LLLDHISQDFTSIIPVTPSNKLYQTNSIQETINHHNLSTRNQLIEQKRFRSNRSTNSHLTFNNLRGNRSTNNHLTFNNLRSNLNTNSHLAFNNLRSNLNTNSHLAFNNLRSNLNTNSHLALNNPRSNRNILSRLIVTLSIHRRCRLHNVDKLGDSNRQITVALGIIRMADPPREIGLRQRNMHNGHSWLLLRIGYNTIREELGGPRKHMVRSRLRDASRTRRRHELLIIVEMSSVILNGKPRNRLRHRRKSARRGRRLDQSRKRTECYAKMVISRRHRRKSARRGRRLDQSRKRTECYAKMVISRRRRLLLGSGRLLLKLGDNLIQMEFSLIAPAFPVHRLLMPSHIDVQILGHLARPI